MTMMIIPPRSSTTLAATRGAPRARATAGDARVGFGCTSGSDEIAQDIKQRLKNYMSGFMDDPKFPGDATGAPPGRASWPASDGAPVKAWESPLAHRLFYEWRANGAACIDRGSMSNLLDVIGEDTEICGHHVGEALIHSMDKTGAECTTWPEYLNSIFAIGPASDPGQPKEDPTEAQLAAERGGGAPAGGPGGDAIGGPAPIPFLYAGDGRPRFRPIAGFRGLGALDVAPGGKRKDDGKKGDEGGVSTGAIVAGVAVLAAIAAAIRWM